MFTDKSDSWRNGSVIWVRFVFFLILISLASQFDYTNTNEIERDIHLANTLGFGFFVVKEWYIFVGSLEF